MVKSHKVCEILKQILIISEMKIPVNSIIIDLTINSFLFFVLLLSTDRQTSVYGCRLNSGMPAFWNILAKRINKRLIFCLPCQIRKFIFIIFYIV